MRYLALRQAGNQEAIPCLTGFLAVTFFMLAVTELPAEVLCPCCRLTLPHFPSSLSKDKGRLHLTCEPARVFELSQPRPQTTPESDSAWAGTVSLCRSMTVALRKLCHTLKHLLSTHVDALTQHPTLLTSIRATWDVLSAQALHYGLLSSAYVYKQSMLGRNLPSQTYAFFPAPHQSP